MTDRGKRYAEEAVLWLAAFLIVFLGGAWAINDQLSDTRGAFYLTGILGLIATSAIAIAASPCWNDQEVCQ